MEKVTITQEQADALKLAIADYGSDNIVDSFTAGNVWRGKLSPLNKLRPSGIAKALYRGYEVEPEFKVGDWVKDRYGKIKQVVAVKDYGAMLEGTTGFTGNATDTYRSWEHPTVKEIEKAKRWRWWTRQGRGVYELREKDLLNINDEYLSIRGFFGDEVMFNNGPNENRLDLLKLFENGNAEVVCFAEDRKDN